MKNGLIQKLGIIAGLSFLLVVALGMIETQISARSARQQEVLRNIAETAAGPQTLVGPVLLLRYRERVEKRVKDEGGHEAVREEIVERTRVLPARRLDISGEARVETRSRGLYRARLFHLALQLTGSVEIPPLIGLDGGERIVDARAFLVLGVADPRGVGTDPEARIDGTPRHFATGTLGAVGGQGMHIALGEIDPKAGAGFDFALPLALTGTERLAIAPTAQATAVALGSAWPHPSFQGRFLPVERTVSDAGFKARWQIPNLARNFERTLQAGGGAAASGGAEVLAVSFMEPVNVYVKSERAVKYGVLFVVLTFASFFLTEILRRAPIHPMQYLLVGLALAIFFLLLIALSEHMPFEAAYGLSAASCVALIGIYLSGALRSRRGGALFAGGIAALYAVLYGVLLSEDNALLMGSLLLFAALGTTMLATRRLDWYRLGPQGTGPAVPAGQSASPDGAG